MKIILTGQEYNLLWLTLNGPIDIVYEDKDYLVKNFGVSEFELKEMCDMLKKYSNNVINKQIDINLSNQEFSKLVRCFIAAKLCLDPIELPTMTGYSWEEAGKLEEKLLNIGNILVSHH